MSKFIKRLYDEIVRVIQRIIIYLVSIFKPGKNREAIPLMPERRFTDWKPKDLDGNTIDPAETYIQYGAVYSKVIERLLDSFEENLPMHDYSLLPIIQLLRHFIEISLKGIIYHMDKSKLQGLIHDIGKAFDIAMELLEEHYGLVEPDIGITDEVEEFIKLLNLFDRRNQFARYPETMQGIEIEYQNMPVSTNLIRIWV